ncbi:MAG TPA: inositol monophosphatase family protein [Gemmataceae bacterium]|nr:inositol monophosphatase family protein [Gemmataceae bacterium]
MNYEPELQAALAAVEDARPAILEAYEHFQPIPDARASISLPVDRQTQEVVLRRLSSAFPGDAFRAEEQTPALAGLAGADSGRPRMWIIDPIDGTRGFAMKNGEFSVMVGLVEGGNVAVGVVLEPLRRRLTYATRGGGCWRRDGDGPAERCRVSTTDQLAGATLTVSRSSTGRHRSRHVEALGDVRLLAAYSAGLKLAHVARGEADLYLNVYPNFNDWDICAGQVLVEEAGGKVCGLRGQEILYGAGRGAQRDGLLATNGRLHEAALAALRAA